MGKELEFIGASMCQAWCWVLLHLITAQNEPSPHSLWVSLPPLAHCPGKKGGLSENKWGAIWKDTQDGVWVSQTEGEVL